MPDVGSVRLVLFPGLGADFRLFRGQADAFHRLEVPERLEPLPFESIRAYAARLAPLISPKLPFYLGGVSFGGILALEVARILKPAGVFLISSWTSSASIPKWLRWLERAARPLPTRLLFNKVLFSPIARAFGPMKREEASLVWEMLAETPPAFIRWACRAVMGWSLGASLSVPVYQIHGERDKVIPVRSVNPDRIIKNGGHLIVLTHSEEVNSFMIEKMMGA